MIDEINKSSLSALEYWLGQWIVLQLLPTVSGRMWEFNNEVEIYILNTTQPWFLGNGTGGL